ncbi:single-stranded-DNA-specific exonuclease RecJ [Terracidiphilus gabretensis]|uniref:single-stranded-DNA-specific exonuclease RecJ n=1 Tax=Terracidiphilus gabretensis TaxID=1577687 RepID=UPI00071B95C4|nr:single-stranded-DNA-specific exonuclease RecJ [Terracidiphilus gabretensis]
MTVKQRWQISPPHPEADKLARDAHIPQPLAELLLARGISTTAEAHIFLNPAADQLHSPALMLGMDAGVERIERAIANNEPILLYGDYDVDGTTAVVLLKTAIEMLGGTVRFHVPHRIREGYGLQSSVLEEARAAGIRLVVTVDTGMRACAEAETARRIGLDLIITDHHLPSASDPLPYCAAILNPNQPGCGYPEKSLCGAAIAFKLAQALLENHESHRRDPSRLREKILPSFLKMAAIATIADAVPLRGENRVIAFLGLRELRRPAAAGLRALFQAAALDPASKAITSFDIAFRIAPRINAAGRMDIASEVIELFTTRDVNRARDLANKLEALNRQRRDAEASALAEIERRLAEDAELKDAPLLVVDGEGWHRGIIGILASRVVERTAKPAFVVSVEDGVAHGSGRSVDGFPLLEALESCAPLFTRFGGHAFAVGFALPAERLTELKRGLVAHAHEKLANREPEHLLRIHAELPLERITPVLAGWLRRLEPLGHGNQEPVFVARGVRVLNAPRIMKERHVRVDLASGPATMRCVGWDWAARCAAHGLKQGSVIDLAYKIRENDHPDYGGIEVEIAGIEIPR